MRMKAFLNRAGKRGREGGRIPDSPRAHGGLDVAVQGDITRCEPAPRHAGPGWVDKLSVTERDACKWDDHSGPTDLWQGSAAFTSSVIGSGVLGQEEYFAGLSVANGRIYLPTYDGTLYCFGVPR